MIKKNKKSEGFTRTPKSLVSGFTLVELIVAVALFAIIVFISLGALLSIFDANRKSQASKTVVDNLNIAMENMARLVRYGSNYHCDYNNETDLGSFSSVANCDGGDTNPDANTLLAFNFEGDTIVYRLKPGGHSIQKSENGGSAYTDITAPEMVVEYLQFRVFGTNPSDNNQPYVLVIIKGYVGSKPTLQSSFSLEVMMSRRILDI